MLKTLKSERVKEKDKKKELEALLGSLADERCHMLINLAKKITDYHVDEENTMETVCFVVTLNQFF